MLKKSIVSNVIKESFISCSAKKKVALQAALTELNKIAPTDDIDVDDKFYQDVLAILREPQA